MEEDAAIFKAILQPHIVDLVNEVLKKQQLDDVHLVVDSDDEEQLQISNIVPQFQFYTQVGFFLQFVCCKIILSWLISLAPNSVFIPIEGIQITCIC
jgi:hypothetical protein